MKIGNNLENLTQIASTPAVSSGSAQKGAVAAEQNSTVQNDSASVSAAAGQVVLSDPASDVRLDKVASIQSALTAGTYAVPASAVASKVVDALLTSKQ